MIRNLRAAAVLAGVLLVPALALAQTSGINKSHMDPTCEPCKDFYRFAIGAWQDTASIPAAYTGIGSGREIADRNQEALHEVLENAMANAATEKDATLRKVGWLYAVLMDSTRTDREGAAPLKVDLDRIAGIQTRADLLREFARTARGGVGGGMYGGSGLPFRLGPEADPGQSTQTIGQFFQGGLGLPDRDYYFRKDPKSEQQRKDYQEYMGRIFGLLGDSPEVVAKKVEAVFALETALAESSLTRVQMRDPKKLYNKMTVKALGLLAPAVDWIAYFKDAGVPQLAKSEATLDVSVPMFMRQASALIESTPMDTWRAYLQWNHARARAGWLGQPWFDAQFAFQAKLVGTQQPLARWKRATQAVDNAMGEALGRAYVEKYFPASSKARMLELVNNLIAAYEERINNLPWMSTATRKQALVKLHAITRKIGYPDKWRDYTKLEIDPTLPAATNLSRAQVFEQQRELAMIGKPVDRGEWGMSPPTVNAYYNPSFNEIVFPAGILQPPMFDPRADDAVNYGGIGTVIGHEITHGFDDEGRQYDSVGNLRDWWTEEDGKKFDEKAGRVERQYDGYVATDTLHVNGKLTLGENIADLGGVTISYHAYLRSLKGKPAPVLDGYTGQQRFFLGYAQAWRRKLRPELERMAALTDPHSPSHWRVVGPLSNFQEFARAFGCRDGDGMVRPADVRAEIW